MFFSGLCNVIKHTVATEFFCVIAVVSGSRSFLRVNICDPKAVGEE